MHVCTLAHMFVAWYACRFVCPDLLIFLAFLLCFPVSRSVRYDGDQFSVGCRHIKHTLSPANSGLFFFLLICTSTSPPFSCTSALPFPLPPSVTAVQGDGSADDEGVSTMLRSDVILYILQGHSRGPLYISNKGLSTLRGSTVCIHCLFLCPVVAAFVPGCQFFFSNF